RFLAADARTPVARAERGADRQVDLARVLLLGGLALHEREVLLRDLALLELLGDEAERVLVLREEGDARRVLVDAVGHARAGRAGEPSRLGLALEVVDDGAEEGRGRAAALGDHGGARGLRTRDAARVLVEDREAVERRGVEAEELVVAREPVLEPIA